MRACLAAAVICVAAFASSSCRGTPVGPDLSNLTVNYSTQSTTVDASACCCRVVGTAVNKNTEPVHVTIKFTALDSKNEEISRTLYFIKDFQRGATHQIDAAGFVFPCSSINRVTAEVEVRGITSPSM